MSVKPLPFAPEDAALIRNFFKASGVSMQKALIDNR